MDEAEDFLSDLEHDLARARARSLEPAAPVRADNGSTVASRNLTRDLLFASIVMPVRNLRPRDISDSWGAPRDGGERKHRGIDLFAPRGTQIVAVADGIISYIGNQPKGGRCLWLATEQGVSFYYAHLERWAVGLYEGMEVRQGDVLGYVGNTGNALTTPPHLHFSILEGDESLNPYPILRRSGRIKEPAILTGGFAGGGAQ
ncbi:MAG TPA: M23 family metallopeptidase [Thermoanaerobaculia bacterium]|nr:M23 family metallopeptidase [Thermoanaerobaculia bacterium]